MSSNPVTPVTQEGLPENLWKTLLDCVDMWEKQDEFDRNRVIRDCKRNHSFFKGIQHIYWSELNRDWRVPTGEVLPDGDEFDSTVLNRIINIFRAHGESVIAALSAGIPHTRFYPEDADSINDVLTSKAYSKLSELIQDQNQAQLLFIQALFILWNEHFVAAYNCGDSDNKYGTVPVPVYDMQDQEITSISCPECGASTDDSSIDPSSQLEPMQCPECGASGMPITQTRTEQTPYIKETLEIAKSRINLAVYGPLNVNIQFNTSKQEDLPYLILETENQASQMEDVYPDLKYKLTDSSQMGKYGRWGRRPADAAVEGRNQVTVRRCWLRLWALNILGKDKENEVAQLREMFPQGIYVVFVDDKYGESRSECLDEYWTINQSPLSRTLHAEPLGAPVIPIQEMRNETVAITAETIDHGIPEIFADPNVLNFQEYSDGRSKPGTISPARPRPGMNLEQSFYTLKPAILSQEVPTFQAALDQDAQFVVGDFPSIYGGANQGGSKTYSEYAMSRNQALQRLSTTWKVLNLWWAQVMLKSVTLYRELMLEDEKFVKPQGTGYINVWIRQSEMTGKVGRCVPETSEQFPVTWEQKRSAIFDLLGLQQEAINQTIFHPENVSLVARTVGLTDLYVPGDEDRDKQLSEIQTLLSGVYIQIDADVDDDDVHIQTIQAWAKSEIGQDAKMTNPLGYQNIIQHLREHMSHAMFLQQQQMAMDPNNQGQGQSDTSNTSTPQKQKKVNPPKPNGQAGPAVSPPITPPSNEAVQ